MNAMTVCCAAVLALSLAGCGGGGGDASAPPPPPAPPTGPEPVTVDGGLITKAIGEGVPLTAAPFTVDGTEVTENPATADDETDDFAKSENSVAPIEGWAGSVYSHSDADGKVVTTVVNYTDIEPPTDLAYLEYYSVDLAPNRDAVSGADADGVLTLDNGEIVASLGLFGAFPGNLAPTATQDFADEYTREGTFNGIPGTFTCDGGCTISSDDESKPSAVTGVWTFTPDGDVAEIVVRGVVPDADYLNLAYWLRSTEAEDGTITYEIGTLAHGNRNEGSGYGSVSQVVGSASYAGPATGLYVRNTFSPGGVPTPAAAGQFTANAELTAFFGNDGSFGTDFDNSISGSVDGFKDSEGNPIGDAWSLSLDRATLDPNGTFTGVATGTSGASSTAGDPGTWSGRFEGDAGDNNAIPSAATGVFHGHFPDGHVAGAFGANKK